MWRWLFGAVLLGACSGAAAPTNAPTASAGAERPIAPIWILAPHPDDEALMAAGVIASAARDGRAPRVHVMTNGDLGCERDGFLRERETVAAMAVLGVSEDRIRFLGYPDGYLDGLGTVALPPLARRMEDGSCGEGLSTYAARGEGGVDVHTALTGAPGAYLAESAISDLAALLERDRPEEIYTSHPIDDHPDHATTYILLRRAIERAHLDHLPRIHRALVHAGGCWPNGDHEVEPCPDADTSLGSLYPSLPGPLAAYAPNEHVAVDDGGRLARRAIAEYRSQLHTEVDHDWLGTFARGESVFWTETLVRDGDRVVRAPAADVPGGAGRVLGPPRSSPDPGDAEAMRPLMSIEQRAPLVVSFRAQVPEGGIARVRVLASEGESETGYTIAVIGGTELEVRRGDDRTLDRIYVPDDGARSGEHVWDVRLDPRPDDGDVLEMEVRRDGVLLGVLVDPAPHLGGDLVLTHTRGGAVLEDVQVKAEAR